MHPPRRTTHIEPLAIVTECDHHNAPSRTAVVDVDVDVHSIIGTSGRVIDNRYLAIIEPCGPVCYAALTLTVDDETVLDVAAGTHPNPERAAAELDRISLWLTGDVMEPDAGPQKDGRLSL